MKARLIDLKDLSIIPKSGRPTPKLMKTKQRRARGKRRTRIEI